MRNCTCLQSLFNNTVPSEAISVIEWNEKMATNVIGRDSEGNDPDAITLTAFGWE